MAWPKGVLDTVDGLNSVSRQLEGRFVGRERAARLLPLAAVCREHLLLLGEPGTAKTELVTLFSRQLDAAQFSYLLTRFTEPSELFGALDVRLFREGKGFTLRTEKMLPEAEFAFLDEVFQGGSAILNSLLALVNERVFHNGSAARRVPLVSLVGASNVLPDDPTLRAFADRFLLRLWVHPVGRTDLDRLVDIGWDNERERADRLAAAPVENPVSLPRLTTAQLAELSRQLWYVDMTAVRPVYSDVIRELLAQGVRLSDRRIVRGQKLVAAAALLRKAEKARPRDLWPLAYFWSEQEDAVLLEELVATLVEDDGGPAVVDRRAPAEILGTAHVLADNLTDPARGAPSDAAVVSTLSALNRLRQELRRDHPGDEASLAELVGIMEKVTAALGAAP
jgi:MoxR-like ATPase